MICSTRERRSLAAAIAVDLGAERRARRGLAAVEPGRSPARRVSGRASGARRCTGRRSPITQAWPMSGLRRLERRLDVRRRHVLAGGVDDQLLLAVDDREVAVGVELADVAGVQPAVGVDASRRSSRAGCGSRASRCGPRTSSSPSSASAHLDSRDRPCRRCPIRDAPCGIDGRDARQLRHAPDLADRRCPRRAKNSSTSTGVGAAPMTNSSHWSSPRAPRIASGALRVAAGLERRLGLLPDARHARRTPSDGPRAPRTSGRAGPGST